MEAAAAQRYATSGLSAVSHRLMKQLLGPKACPINGFAFSPLSIYSTLSLMVAGSRGSTLRKLLDVFGASSRLGIVGESEDMVSRGFAGYPDPEGPYIYHLSQLWHDTMPKVKPDYGLTAHRLWCFPSTVDFRTRVSPQCNDLHLAISNSSASTAYTIFIMNDSIN
jgi:serine protease inhibitor